MNERLAITSCDKIAYKLQGNCFRQLEMLQNPIKKVGLCKNHVRMTKSNDSKFVLQTCKTQHQSWKIQHGMKLHHCQISLLSPQQHVEVLLIKRECSPSINNESHAGKGRKIMTIITKFNSPAHTHWWRPLYKLWHYRRWKIKMAFVDTRKKLFGTSLGYVMKVIADA